jgi:hypothetical protein
MFEKGQCYTRQEISTKVGGSVMDCLSHTGNRVVAVCMKKEMNPEAPFKLLVGSGPDKKRYSDILCTEQKNDIVPIFVKLANNCWEFRGNFKVEKSSKDKLIIEPHEKGAGRRDVYMLIKFREV